MRAKLVWATVLALAVLAGAFGFVFAGVRSGEAEAMAREDLVTLNEVYHLQKEAADGDGEALQALERRQGDLRESLLEQAHASERGSSRLALVLFAVCAAFVVAIALYSYVRVVRPFERLQSFAADVAKGDLGSALPRERHNLFGDFTWAFDRMRNEVSAARAAEARAIEANKTVIAGFSHDIKTPTASIRAYAEALEMGLDEAPEDRRRYASKIMSKCDELADLTDDLFLHAVSDLDKLEVVVAPHDARDLIEDALRGIPETMGAEGEERACVRVVEEVPPVIVLADSKRFSQVVGNIVTNARKYAPGSPVDVKCVLRGCMLEIRFEDKGPGVAPGDLPFLFDKFYRGSNVGDAAGAGLGLAIVAHLMERMKGSVSAENTVGGFAVMLSLPVDTSEA